MTAVRTLSAAEPKPLAPRGASGAPAHALVVRCARVADAPAIVTLVASWAEAGLTLRRSLGDVLGTIGSFVVVEWGGRVIACGATDDCGKGLGEIRSVAVAYDAKGVGAGRAVVEGLVARAPDRGFDQLVLLTKTPAFFERTGFRAIELAQAPAWFVRERLVSAGRSTEGRTVMRLRLG
jgi:N-acetylglutamate synthase-like GNAT family acetyltransferase